MSIQAVGSPDLHPPGFDPRNRLYSPTGAGSASMEANIATLVERLCPPQQMTSQSFPNTAAGVQVVCNVLQNFNGILPSLSTGVVYLYFGPEPKGAPDLVLGVGYINSYIPLPSRADRQVCLVVAANSPDPAFGSVHFLSY